MSPDTRRRLGDALADAFEEMYLDTLSAHVAATPPPEPIEQHTLGTAQAAELLGVGEKYVLQLAHAGALPYRKAGRAYLFRREDVLAWEQREIDATSGPVRLHARRAS